MSSAAKSMISFATTELLASLPWPATGTVFGLVSPQRLSPQRPSSRSASPSLRVPSLLQEWWKRLNMAFPKSILSDHSSWAKAHRILARNLRSICCAGIVSGHAWSMPRVVTSTKHAHYPIPICRRTFPLWIWAATDMQSFASLAIGLKRSLFVSLARSNGVSASMEARSSIALDIEQRCGVRVKGRGWICRFLRAIHGFRSEAAVAQRYDASDVAQFQWQHMHFQMPR